MSVNVLLDKIAGLGAPATFGPGGYDTTFSACAVSSDGKVAYFGRTASYDPAMRNLVVASLDVSGNVIGIPQCYPTSARALAPIDGYPVPGGYQTTISTILLNPDKRQLYMAEYRSGPDPPGATEAGLNVYTLDAQGHPRGVVRSYPNGNIPGNGMLMALAAHPTSGLCQSRNPSATMLLSFLAQNIIGGLPMDSPQYTSLYTTLSALPDPRHARGQRYAWPLLLVLVAAALLAEQKNVRAIADWAALRAATILPLLPEPAARIPSRSTFYRVLRLVDITLLEQYLAAYAQQLAPPVLPREPVALPPVPTPPVLPPTAPATPCPAPPQLQGLAVDGKTVRGVRAHGVPCHLVSVVRHAQGVVLDQERCALKEQELTVVPRLLARQDLRHTVVTCDALSTHSALAQQIRAQQGHYLMVVKANQPDLLADIALLFAQPSWGAHPTPLEYARYRYTTKGHGRLETRTLERSAELNDYLVWPDVGQVLRRTCERVDLQTGEITVTVSYGITSLPAATISARQVERFWRGHWTIENKVHYVRDETMREDRCQVHTGSAPQVLAALRNAALNLVRSRGWPSVADALRYYAAAIPQTFQLLIAPGL